RGRSVRAARPFDEILRRKDSVNGQYLSGVKEIALPKARRTGNGQAIPIRGARHHNLKNIPLDIPLGRFVAVTGVSGSGKSSLINDIMLEGLRQRYGKRSAEEDEENGENGEAHNVGGHDRITGVGEIDKGIGIDQ